MQLADKCANNSWELSTHCLKNKTKQKAARNFRVAYLTLLSLCAALEQKATVSNAAGLVNI